MKRLEVGFCADNEGTFRLTWGQENFWRQDMRPYGDVWRHFNLPMVIDLPGDVDQAEVTAVLRRLIERNQVLRTHFFFNGPGGPVQRVARTGTFTVRLRHSTPEASRADADALAAELAAATFDHETEWGIRLALVCAGQSPRHLVLGLSHLAVDGGGIQALFDDFFAMLRTRAGGTEPQTRWQPSDQVGREQSERGARRSDGAIRHWRRQLREVPPSMFGAPAGAQDFINSWADEFASWGVDYVKLDGVGDSDIPDIEAWSAALEQTGRPIHLELSNSLDIANAATWAGHSNGWRTGGDIECYCGPGGASYPLTDWSNVQSRFAQVAQWQPYGGPGAFNDYDSIEVGNGPADDGVTDAEAQSQLSLWSLAASPLLLGVDLSNLNSTELGYLKNTAVIAADQDGIDARRIVSNVNQQVFSKTEQNGDVILGLFNYSGSASQTVSVSLAAAGVGGSATATNLWTGGSAGTLSGTYSVTLGPGAVQLLKLTPLSGTAGASSYDAASSSSTLAGGAVVASCSSCPDGEKVGYVGDGGTLTFNDVNVSASGNYAVQVGYLDGTSGTVGRSATITVNGIAGTLMLPDRLAPDELAMCRPSVTPLGEASRRLTV